VKNDLKESVEVFRGRNLDPPAPPPTDVTEITMETVTNVSNIKATGPPSLITHVKPTLATVGMCIVGVSTENTDTVGTALTVTGTGITLYQCSLKR